MIEVSAHEPRIIVLAPRGRDAAVATALLERHGLAATSVQSLAEVVEMPVEDIGILLVAEEALVSSDFERLIKVLGEQPPWSDLPSVVLTNGSKGARSNSEIDRIDALNNVVLLSRPLHTEDLVRAVKSALKARRRQYDARDRLMELERQGAQLRASEEKFQATVNSVDHMVWSTLPDGYHDFYNNRWYEYTGVPEGSTDGEAWNGVFHPDDQERAFARWNRSLATGEPYEIEYRLRHRSGEYRWVLGKAQPVLDDQGRIARWYGTCTDIHERVQARGILAKSRENLERTVAERTAELGMVIAERDRAWEMSVDLLVVATPDGLLRQVNSSWRRLLGWEKDELIDKPFADLTHPDDIDSTLAKFATIIETPLIVPFEFRLRHKDGSYRSFAWTASANEGKIYASGRDVTEQNEQAEVLAKTERALRQSQKLETIGQLTGGVAHDFNNLLMAIRSSLDLLERRLPSDDERIVGLIQNARKATDRGADLTQRMLAFARKQELDPKPVDVAHSLEEMKELIERTIGPMVAVELELDEDVPHALVDSNQLEMAVLNLALNGRDAMDGTGKLNIRLDSLWIDEHPELHVGNYVRIRVSDTGAGMDPETLAQAMEPFFTTKGIGKGTGLGLSMVHGLANQSGGAFRLHSQVGVGTTASLFIPVAQQAVASSIREKANGLTNMSGGRALKILAVDDDGLVLFGTIALLEDLGHQVVEANSGQQAIELFQTNRDIDLVITDQAMPNMTGVELARILRETKSDLPVILASGYAEMPDGAGAHIAHRIEKPFGEQVLKEAIDAIVGVAHHDFDNGA